MNIGSRSMLAVLITAAALASSAWAAAATPASGAAPPTFATPEDAVQALTAAVKGGDLRRLIDLFGSEGQDLVDTSDTATGRRNREVFLAALAEGWRLEDAGEDRKELVLGNESWPFPVPLVREAAGWRFDAAAGKEEILARRIGRNELAVIDICRTYVLAQRAYAASGHDGKPAGRFARSFRSAPGTQSGLYWPAAKGAPRSPLGDLVAQAESAGYRPGTDRSGPSPLHGYYFRILEAQGAGAPGGAREYVANGEMTGGFALVAWPVHYDASGVMTFIVNTDGVVYERDLGPDTQTAVKSITRFDTDDTWRPVVGSGVAP